MKLSKEATRLYYYILLFAGKHNFMPTQREMARMAKMTKYGVWKGLKELKEKELVFAMPHRPRAMSLPGYSMQRSDGAVPDAMRDAAVGLSAEAYDTDAYSGYVASIQSMAGVESYLRDIGAIKKSTLKVGE